MVNKVLNTLKSNEDNNYKLIVNNQKDKDLLSFKMIKRMFENQNVTVNKGNENNNNIIIYKNNSIVSKSSIEELGDSILYTNSDQYKTQQNQMKKLVFPKSILSLQDEIFELKGYPKKYNEKLILILISRYIEKLSYTHGGVHHSTFQKISRINDEKGTKEVYDKLSNNVDKLHIYGQLDTEPELNGENIIFNFGSSDTYKYSWVVIHLSKNYSAALTAIKKPNKFNEWNAIWTFDREKVIRLENEMDNYF